MKKAIIVILSIIVIAFVWMNHSKYKQAFESNKWKEWVESEQNLNVRWQMIGSLTFKQKLKGMNKAEIKSLLGEPTIENVNNWSYNLGPTGIGINYGLLRVQFKKSIVTQYEVIEH